MLPPPFSCPIATYTNPRAHRPKFTIALIRTPRLSPYHARFQVPLNFSKYDLRDYLYHAYNIKTFNIRSVVKQSPIYQDETAAGHLIREESKKFMTVEMEKPFVWPKKPEDMSPWGAAEAERQRKLTIEEGYKMDHRLRREEAHTLRAQAKELLARGTKEEEKKKTPLQLWQEKRTESRLGQWR